MPAAAQVPVTAAADQEALLASKDAKLAANKRLICDFWREVFEGGHMEFADKYLTERSTRSGCITERCVRRIS